MNNCDRNRILCGAAALLMGLVGLTASSALAQTTRQLTFDDLVFGNADGQSIGGVSFAFQIGGASSTDAFVASYGPGTMNYVSDPSLTGNAAGTLLLDFLTPTPRLEFGVAVSSGLALNDAIQVQLLDDAGATLGQYAIDTSVNGPLGFSEALFAHLGPAVSRAQVSFAGDFGSFALDNLVYEVPEPAAALLLAPVVAVFGRLRRTRQSRLIECQVAQGRSPLGAS